MVNPCKLVVVLIIELLVMNLFSEAFGNEQGSKNRLLNILMNLRKCVDHPYLFDGETNYQMLKKTDLSIYKLNYRSIYLN